MSLFAVAVAAAFVGAPAPAVAVAALDHEIQAFLEQELAAHFRAVPGLEPPPESVHGALTTGEFTWGTFMRALATQAEAGGRRELAGRDLARWIGRMGVLESQRGGKAFSQLYAALALRHFGADLATNPLWQGLTADERRAWESLLDPSRFYDARARRVIGLPENYLGVASRIAAIAWEVGLAPDRVLLDSLLDRAIAPFTAGALYADDAPPTGRFDRYSNEYARYGWEASERAGRSDLLAALRPSLRAQSKLWWDLVAPDGYGYPWGRSLGVVSYLDTLEIVAFLARHPDLRPAPLAHLAGAYARAWRWLRKDYRDEAHLLSVFAPGRGNYAYISREREWQQTAGFLGKLGASHRGFVHALTREGIAAIPAETPLPDVARFEFFDRGPRPSGVWLVRQGGLRFALPFTTGPRPGVADYLPSPHGLPGFAAPVEQVFPALTPFLELADGRVVVAGDGADAIEPAPDGRSVRASWHRFAVVGGRPGENVDPGLATEVLWRLDGESLVRSETLTAPAALRLRRFWIALPVTAGMQSSLEGGEGTRDRFEGHEGVLEATFIAPGWRLQSTLIAADDVPLGRGARGALPLRRVVEARALELGPGRPSRFDVRLEVRQP